jgi:tetratricopeptide (TPR) repeat protein
LCEFNIAIKEYNDRFVYITKHRIGKKNIPEEKAFSMHKISTIVALGVSWCNYTRGAISTAIQGNLIPARMLLQQTGDVLNRAYADVVYASASRALARKGDVRELNDARELVLNARQVFERYRHEHYRAGATLELALIESLLGETKKATYYLGKCEASHAQGNSRWACSAKIVRSRILRHRRKYAQAREVACEALDLARKRRDRLAQIDALIARSEAYRLESREKHDLAIEDLNRALDLNQTTDGGASFANRKVHAVCHLHLAQLFLSHDRKDKALASFAEWEKVSTMVEHAWVRDMAENLSQKIGRMQTLTVDPLVHGLKYRAQDDRLRRFLVEQARLVDARKYKIAPTLGISRPRLDRWLRRFQRSAG